MDKKLLAKIEQYLQDNYIDPSTVFFQMSARCEDEEAKYSDSPASHPSDGYYHLELNLPPLEDTFASQLLKLIHAKGKTEAEVYKKACIDRRLFSKIRTNRNYTPSKATILALIIALELKEEEARDLLERAGYVLSRSQKSDVIIHFFIQNRIYDFFIINETLAYYGIKMLWGV